MNIPELVKTLSEELNLPVTTGSSIINTILDTMTETLVKGDNIELRGFGSFTVKHYDSFIGRNPATGVEAKVKEKKLPFWKVGKDLREAVNAGRK